MKISEWGAAERARRAALEAWVPQAAPETLLAVIVDVCEDGWADDELDASIRRNMIQWLASRGQQGHLAEGLNLGRSAPS